MDIPQIQVDEVEALVASGATVIDVREVDEYTSGHVPGAINLPLSDFAGRVDELPDGELLMICQLGGRSQRAAEFLAQAERQASNVVGGTAAWIEAGNAVTTGPQPV